MHNKDLLRPDRIKTLPTDARGYPVFFTAHVNPDGIPNFRVIDAKKRDLCAAKKLCGVCGQALSYYIYFIGGPLAVENRAFGDPPMHKECADFSAKACPYLSTRAERRFNDPITRQPPGGVREKPAKICIYETRSFSVVRTPEGFVFRAAPALSVEERDFL